MKRLFINRKNSVSNTQKDAQILKGKTDQPNPGDYWCTPLHYWADFALDAGCNDWIDITDVDIVGLEKYDQIIVGGGGLLGNSNFEHYIHSLLPYSDRVWFWGAGINRGIPRSKEISSNKWNKLIANSTVKSYGLKGFDKDKIFVRDYAQTHNYLPCVTCMHPVFDTVDCDVTQDYLILAHNKVKTLLTQHAFFDNKTRLLQPKTGIDKIAKEIKRSKYIVTNSYHGAYWSMLCNKPVVIVSPWTNKFLFFKHQPPIITPNELSLIVMKELAPKKSIDCFDFRSVETYPNYLEECRTANRELYLNLRSPLCKSI